MTHPDVEAAIIEHRLGNPDILHSNLVAADCSCRALNSLPPRPAMLPSVSSGNSCSSCGGMTVRTGTCETCTQCGTSGGCG